MLSSFDIFSYKLPSRIGKRKGLLLRITDSNGRMGVGEVAPLAGINLESLSEAEEELKEVKKKFLEGDLTPMSLLPSVHFGLSSALSQLAMEEKDFSFQTIELLEEGKEPTLSEVKVKIGELSVEEAVKRCASLLEKGHKLRLDANGKWELREALSFCKHFKPSDFRYIEDPVHRLTHFQPFYEESGFSFAVDRPLLSQPLENILSLKGLSHLIIKPMALGGYDRLQMIKEKAGSIPLVFSNSYETPIGLLHTLALADRLSPKEAVGIDPVVEAPFFKKLVDIRSGFVPSSIFLKMPILFSRLTKL
ncbi:MAG: o-succinylbenzoate synthase [Verrucomicrobia bacterium]|nr:o-succinylbenzoate synthase [Verrucomicrobiota bacterium]